jgi:hypothetical protein
VRRRVAKEHCVNVATVLSFFVGCAIGTGLALLVAPRTKAIEASIRSAVGRGEKLTREQIIEEGMYCAVPEGMDICFPSEETNG